MSDRESFDAFLGDMAGHQSAHVGEVTGRANQVLAAPLFERLDNQEAERKPAPPPLPAAPPPVRQSDIEAAKRGYRIVRAEDELPAIAPPMSIADRVRAAAYKRRLELLLSKVETGPLGQPSWAQRLKAILVEQVVDPRTRTKVARATLALVEESELVFGSIFTEAPRKVYSR